MLAPRNPDSSVISSSRVRFIVRVRARTGKKLFHKNHLEISDPSRYTHGDDQKSEAADDQSVPQKLHQSYVGE